MSIFLVSRPRFCHLCQPWLFSKCVTFPSEKIRDTPACSSMSIPMYSRPVHTIYTTQLSPYVYLFMPDCSSSCGCDILPSGQFRSPEHKNNYLHVCSIYVRTYLMYVQSFETHCHGFVSFYPQEMSMGPRKKRAISDVTCPSLHPA